MNMMTNALQVAPAGERELTITRGFAAPRHLVFDAHTRPELVKRWLKGPDGWELAVCEIDLKVGGKYRYVWKKGAGADDGMGGYQEMGMGGEYREIAVPERLVNTELFDMDWTGGETLCTLVLVEEGGHTTLTNTIRYSSAEARDAVLASDMEKGLAPSYDRLDALLEEAAHAA